jgi:transaldolase
MTKLQQLFGTYDQSPWLDNLPRLYLRDGTLQRMVRNGIRGVTANPTILARAIQGSDAYDDQFRALVAAGCSSEVAYWELVVSDVSDACSVLEPIFDASRGRDGFVSVEVAPDLAHDTAATITAARALHERLERSNLLVKIPATPEGIPAIRTMTAEGRSINVTLVFSLTRYAEVIEAYLGGLEALAAEGGDLATVHGVASFFVSRVDTEVDRRLGALDGPSPAALRSRAAIAQARLAYQLFREQFAGERWTRLAALGAHVQRPLWASTSTKDPALPDTRYVDSLIGPDTVTTLPESTIAAFEHHGRLGRTLDADTDEAREVMRRLGACGVDMDDVGVTLEDQGIAAFDESFREVLRVLDAKVAGVGAR